MTPALSLCELHLQLMALAPGSPRIVAFEGAETKTSHDFLTRIGQFRQLAREHKAHRWGIYLQSGYDFAACFIGLLQAGKQPIILPKAQPSFLEQLNSELDAIFLDQAILGKNTFGLENLPEHHLEEFRSPLSPQLKLALFTSGSTGEPKRVEKTLANIESELSALEKLWAEDLKGSITLSTVSHQHIYGLLFQVLWPLCSGRPFDTRVYDYPSDLLERLASLDSSVLVSSPSHLNRMTRLVELGPQRSRLVALFSSGGPLERQAALELRETLGRGVREVFGSTETGGVAYRCQDESSDSKLWRPFEVVAIRRQAESGKLSISSPYVDPEWYEMEDRVRLLDDGSFELLGRSDRVAKVEGKRVSLTEIETRLKCSGLVKDARALVMTDTRSYVVVVLTTSDKGKDMLDKGKLADLKALLKDDLASYFERVLLPRKWRVVEEFPLNQQGKSTEEDLKMLFKQEKKDKAVVLSVEQSENQVEMSLSVPAATRYFEGHFPGQPVLPGVVQVDWAADFAMQYFHPTGPFTGLEAVKFHEFILPNARVTLVLKHRPDQQKVSFAFSGDNCKYSSGRLLFG